MREFVKPRVIISKCIGFEACRYNGLIIKSDFVEKLKDFVDFYPICPEVEIGLGVPRDPIRIIELEDELRLYQPSTELDLTEKMKKFIDEFLDNVHDIDGFILKNRSPSCGIKAVKVYQGFGNSRTKSKPGFFGNAVLERFSYLAIEDEGRLRNLKIREIFLTKLYTLAGFRKVKESRNLNALIKFHSDNKMLLMAYNQENMRKMGRIISNHDNKPFDDLISKYESLIHDSILDPPQNTANINVLMHAMGYFKNEIISGEKSFFLDSIEKYRKGIYPLFVCLNILKSWIIRFNNEYLGEQTFFEPYPEELIPITSI
ncbi:YbgA family protein [Methanobacterium oryzae]|uniref:YbgA family protein n=1 Tax=Methanobacterium oryzae TaxID=69540 RepID=UPI003D1C7665